MVAPTETIHRIGINETPANNNHRICVKYLKIKKHTVFHKKRQGLFKIPLPYSKAHSNYIIINCLCKDAYKDFLSLQ